MRRVLILVEGQTEERFVKDVLQPHLWARDVHTEPKLATTGRPKQGGHFKGGIVGFGKVERDLRNLLRDRDVALVTTMIDLYGLPSDFPGRKEVRAGIPAAQQVVELERALEKHINDSRFRAFYLLHEFEGLLFSKPEVIAQVLMAPKLISKLQAIRLDFPTPEDINNEPQTAPSKRILDLLPGYRKPIYGAEICKEIGLHTLRAECPHFAQWLGLMEALGG